MNYPITQIARSELFPELDHLPQMPATLYYQGSLPSGIRISFVGSRTMTPYGSDVVRMIIKGLAKYPAVIVSGLAFGIDSFAHECALEYGLPTIAIPGSGLDRSVLHPQAHVRLADTILDHKGMMVSPFTATTKGSNWTFPTRNRLIAGISEMVIIIEAQAKSGTLITASYALEYGKRIGAVPGPVTSPHSFGTNNLLKMGAVVICDAIDIAREIGWSIPDIQSSPEQLVLNEFEVEIMRIISIPTTRGEIAHQLRITSTELGIALSILEMKGYISEEMGLVRRVV
jgi:DNA processing protein